MRLTSGASAFAMFCRRHFCRRHAVVAVLVSATLASVAAAELRRRGDCFEGPVETGAGLPDSPSEEGSLWEALDEDRIVRAPSCGECHQSGVTDGASPLTGLLGEAELFESLGGSRIPSRAVASEIEERVAFEGAVRAFRISTILQGAGFVEAVAHSTLLGISEREPRSMLGTAPVRGPATAEVIHPHGDYPASSAWDHYDWLSSAQKRQLMSFSIHAGLGSE